MEEQNNPTNPDYYKQGGVECIDAIEASLKGNAMKYLSSEKTPGGDSSGKSYTPDGDISSYVMDEFSKSFGNPPFAYPPEEGAEEDDSLQGIADIMEGIADSFRNLRTDG